MKKYYEKEDQPYHYTKLDTYASPIKNRLLNLSNALKSDIEIINAHDTTNHYLIDLKKLTNSLAELDLKSIYAQSKTYWESRKYAEEQIRNTEDIEEMFKDPRVKKLTDGASEQTMHGNIQYLKRLIDRRAKDIKCAERNARFVILPEMYAGLRKIANKTPEKSPEKSVEEKQNKLKSFYKNKKRTKIIRKIQTTNQKSFENTILNTPVEPIFSEVFTPSKSSPKFEHFENLANRLDIAKIKQSSIRHNLAPLKRARTPYKQKITNIISDCNNWTRSYKAYWSQCKDTREKINKNLRHISNAYISPIQGKILFRKSEIKQTVNSFHKRKKCFIYGKNGLGSYMADDAKPNLVKKSDSIVRINSIYAKNLLKDYVRNEKKNNSNIF